MTRPRGPRPWARLLLLATTLAVVACAHPKERPVGPGPTEPALEADRIIATDGYPLPLRRWLPEAAPEAVVLAVHGFNDYGGAFSVLADPLNRAGMALYAYDQRGFGAAEPQGIWAGRERMVDDLITATRLLRGRYPGRPVYLVGMSMGGAVTLLAHARGDLPEVAGTVLISPAVWGEDVMPWYQRLGLWVGEAVTPGMPLSADLAEALGTRSTDDEAVLEAMRDNPLVQRSARVDTIDGLSELMDHALAASARLTGPALILYGGRDEIIPPEPVCLMLDRLPGRRATPWRMAFYPDGYHMLTRYTGAAAVRRDIVAWLDDPAAALPSGHEVDRAGARRRICP